MTRNFRALSFLVAVLLVTPALFAQNTFGRDARWEFTLSPLYSLSTGIDFEGGSQMDTSDELGFAMGLGYNFGERLNLNFGFQWGSIDYDADIVDAENPANNARISGSYDQWTTWFGGEFNFLDRPITPFVSGGIGWSWFDTNIPNGLPQTGCYWDPWYGYICYNYYPTKTVDAFSYKAGLGLRWDVNPKFFMKAGYEMQLHQLSNADGDPDFGVIKVDFGFFF